MTIVAEPQLKKRIQSIDILRGAIMLIMALDHVRDYFHFGGPLSNPTDLATTTPILFLPGGSPIFVRLPLFFKRRIGLPCRDQAHQKRIVGFFNKTGVMAGFC